MTWNNRIIKENVDNGVNYQIHEVFYNTKGQIEGWTVQSVGAYGEYYHELRNDIMHLMSAFNLPVLVKKIDENGKEILVNDEEEPTHITDGYSFEAMDRAAVAMAHFSDFVGSHPVVRKDQKLNILAQTITNSMYKLYRSLAESAIPEK